MITIDYSRGRQASPFATIASMSSCGALGRTMGALKERYAGQMDFGKVGATVKEALSS